MSFRMSVMALVAMIFIDGLMIVGCGGGSSPTKPVTPPPSPPPSPPTVASIVVNPTSASLVVEELSGLRPPPGRRTVRPLAE